MQSAVCRIIGLHMQIPGIREQELIVAHSVTIAIAYMSANRINVKKCVWKSSYVRVYDFPQMEYSSYEPQPPAFERFQSQLRLCQSLNFPSQIT